MIKVFSKNDCPACVGVMNMLANNNVEFDEIKVDEDEEALDELKGMGYASVPVTVTKTGKEIVGFDLPELQKLFK